MSNPDPIVEFVDKLPDLVKLTIVGIALDPPTVDLSASEPNFIFALNFLVEQGVAVSTTKGTQRTYYLTALGSEVADEVNTRRLSDGSVATNDDDELPPEAA